MVATVLAEGIVVFTNKHARLQVNNSTVTVLRLPQLPRHILSSRPSFNLSQKQIESIGNEIVSQNS
jgi:hypothetical protein